MLGKLIGKTLAEIVTAPIEATEALIDGVDKALDPPKKPKK
jgi:hypothetical protein